MLYCNIIIISVHYQWMVFFETLYFIYIIIVYFTLSLKYIIERLWTPVIIYLIIKILHFVLYFIFSLLKISDWIKSIEKFQN